LDLSASNSNPSFGDAGSPQVNLLQLRDITSVPEPSTLTLGVIACIALVCWKQRTKCALKRCAMAQM
jgi:hypothetical protein